MRGKGSRACGIGGADGITPACAGKRIKAGRSWSVRSDHPRVCGEKGLAFPAFSTYWGSPPRVRGKVSVFHGFGAVKGITPACAGKSNPNYFRCNTGGDHPRVCGEKWPVPAVLFCPLGSPPRVRGKVVDSQCTLQHRRITPACAGKRGGPRSGQGPPRDHPRVCGEKYKRRILPLRSIGSPPRVRGKD